MSLPVILKAKLLNGKAFSTRPRASLTDSEFCTIENVQLDRFLRIHDIN